MTYNSKVFKYLLVGILSTWVLQKNAEAQINLANAKRFVALGQTDNRILIYKIKSQNSNSHLNSNLTGSKLLAGAISRPLFDSVLKQKGISSITKSDLSRYQVKKFIRPVNSEQAQKILQALYADPSVEFAYFEVRPTNADLKIPMLRQNATQDEQLLAVPNFESKQFYLDASPKGVGARQAWRISGGTGAGIRIVDIENGWQLDHPDFKTPWLNLSLNLFNDHGTAVWGEIAALNDGIGITGIAYDAEFGVAGNDFQGFDKYPKSIAETIAGAVVNMRANDILVIEQHAPLVSEFGPIEYFEPVFKILNYATQQGIHCIAAAGNGGSNLDDLKYQGAFDANRRDSGCILVGAASPPINSASHQRLWFSSYGSRVDTFGYGMNVTTTGYGDLFSLRVDGKSVSYTSDFSGTSSATPIVVGAVASALGIARAQGKMIAPLKMREAIRKTGYPQQGNKLEAIGNLPNIPEIVRYLGI